MVPSTSSPLPISMSMPVHLLGEILLCLALACQASGGVALTVLLLVERAVTATAAEGVRLRVTLTAVEIVSYCASTGNKSFLYSQRGGTLLTIKARPGQRTFRQLLVPLP